MESREWRDVIVTDININMKLFELIFDEFRREMRNTRGCLYIMKDCTDLRFYTKDNNFHFYNINEKKYGGIIYPQYPFLQEDLNYHNKMMKFEDYVVIRRYKHFIKNLALLYTRV